MMLSNMLELRDSSGDMLFEKVELSLETMKVEGTPKRILPGKIFVLIISLIRRTRLSNLQSECGLHHPKIATTILI